MYKRILLVLLLFLFTTSTVFAYEPDSNNWRWYTSDDTNSIYVYKSPPKIDNFNKANNTIMATAIILMINNNSSDYAYVIQKAQIFYDFNYRTMKGRYLYCSYYDDNGNIIYSDDSTSNWMNYLPETVGEAIGFAVLTSVKEHEYFYKQHGLMK